MNARELQQMIVRYNNGNASAEEKHFLETYYVYAGNRGDAQDNLNVQLLEQHQQESLQELHCVIDKTGSPSDLPVPVRALLARGWWRYAAAVIVITTMTALLYWNNRPERLIVKNNQSAVILPGGHKAVLILSDGSTITLDSASKGDLVSEGNAKVTKNGAGSLAYTAAEKGEGVVYHTLKTPKGGQYLLVLPDGSKVWLNAASSIRFPTIFNEKTRTVKVTGEACFEVVKDRARPFIVETYKDEITVLGTIFNVNSYLENKAVKTSLVEGLVSIDQHLIQPGQAYVKGMVVSTDLDQDLAWKNGVFNFSNLLLPEAMQQLARWYDVEVSYKPEMSGIEFGGKMGRNLSLQQVIRGLEGMQGMHFKLEGKTLTVTR